MHKSKATPNIKEEKAPMMKGNASHTNSAHHTHSEEGTGVEIISKGNVQQKLGVPHRNLENHVHWSKPSLPKWNWVYEYKMSGTN